MTPGDCPDHREDAGTDRRGQVGPGFDHGGQAGVSLTGDGGQILTKDRHAVFGTGVRARTTPMLASLRVHGIHLIRQRQGQVCHFCHKQWITSRHTGTSGE